MLSLSKFLPVWESIEDPCLTLSDKEQHALDGCPLQWLNCSILVPGRLQC